MSKEPQAHRGQPSWPINSKTASGWVTEKGAMLGPVEFEVEGQKVSPFLVAPWAEEDATGIPEVVQALRGDFFAMPFGGIGDPYLGEDHPRHGETGNKAWTLDAASDDRLELVLDGKIRPWRAHRSIRLVGNTVYQRTAVFGLSGPISYGSHALLSCATVGNLSTSPFRLGQVCPAGEDPARGGYSFLEPGSTFAQLERVEGITGEMLDLTTVPGREGYDDRIQLGSPAEDGIGWTACAFPEQGFLYFQIKDLSVLPSTVVGFTNGGRHYPPFSGRFKRVLALCETMAYFDFGLRGSVVPNLFQQRGVPTFADIDPSKPLVVSLVSGVAGIPRGFDRVERIVLTGDRAVFVAANGLRSDTNLDGLFLRGG
ncbi:MAG: hypothetical protein KIT11_03965 [Fimbriimonadaceae bacterium]|nr:hypothetical protein [Fimbriimonadaceae bacterium]QYK56948.1 MAG: hypothetical protein KF733_05560 [Fimbriimonadaceae bacterium]